MNPQENYDFILNPMQPKKPSPFSGAGGSMSRRIWLIAGGAVLLVIIMYIVGALLGGGGTNTIADLTGIAETQQEIIRVATLAAPTVTQTSNQYLAVNTEATVTTQQKGLVDLLAKNGKALSDKMLALKQNSTTDTQLTTAQQNSTYDVVFAQIMQSELSGYMSEMQQVYKGTTSTAVRSLLSADYTQTAALLKQVPAASTLTGQ